MKQSRLELTSTWCILLMIVTIMGAAVFPFFFFSGGPRVLPKEAKSCLSCHKDIAAQYSLSYLHSPFDKGECADCHLAKNHPPQETKLTTATEKGLCISCHQRQAKEFKRTYVHKPFDAGKCTDCHKPHASRYRNLLVKSTGDFCITCHRIKEERALAEVHPPFEKHQCWDCHASHASDVRGMLADSQRVICLLCHKEIADDMTLVYQHDPVEEGRCTDCHQPHSSPYRSLLLALQPSVCYSCHTDVRLDFSRASRHPVGTRQLNCTGCHRVHGSRFARLLVARGNGLCFTCHGDKGRYYLISAHNEVEKAIGGVGLCINCHNVHGSDEAPLLARESVSLCLECHYDLSNMKVQHPVGAGYFDFHVGRRLTCSSSCHDPHGTAKRAMLRMLPDGLCLTCHSPNELP